MKRTIPPDSRPENAVRVMPSGKVYTPTEIVYHAKRPKGVIRKAKTWKELMAMRKRDEERGAKR